MTNLTETETWEEGVYQIELTDPVVGGADGISNRQAKQLANRTTWLKARVDALISGTVSAFKATKLATARTLSISGAGTGSASFDGSANANIALTLADSGVGAGSYPKVTVNAKGLVTGGGALLAADIPILDWSKIGGGKPTTLAGYGITDGAPLNSPVFTGNPTCPTPPQFDSDLSLVNSGFVQRALGNYRAFGALLNGTVISEAHLGGVYQPGEGATILFPTPASLGAPTGATVTIAMLARVAATLQGSGGATFAMNLNGITNFRLVRGQTVLVTAINGNEWAVLNNSKYDDSFSSSLGPNGYQKLPSELIEQWGSFVVPASATGAVIAGAAWEFTLPTTFPNGWFQVVASFANPNAGTTGAEISGNKIYLKNSHTTPQVVRWMAKGY